MKPLIVIGDRTSHGGTVITCSSLAAIEGKGWARVGDMVSCPRCKGVFPIVQGDAKLRDGGRGVAYDGCKTACGATLISSQTLILTGPVTGAAPGAAASLPLTRDTGAISTSLAGRYLDEPAGTDKERYRGRFQLVDAITGEPVRDQAVQVRSTDGRCLVGQTDENGFTAWVERDECEALALRLIGDGGA